MGSETWLLPLDPLTGVERGDEDAVRSAVWGVLVKQWNTDLGGEPVTQNAIDWLDDTLTLELGQSGDQATLELTFNLSVDWPMDLADHWLRVAIAVARVELDDALAQVGWRLSQHGGATLLPSITSEVHRRRKGSIYFEHDGVICSADREDLFRHLRIDGESIDEQCMPLASLEPSDREAVVEKAASPRCQCPPCANTRSDWSEREKEDGEAGHIVEPLHVWPWNWDWRFVPSRDGKGLWFSEEERPHVYAGWDGGVRVERCDLPRVATPKPIAVATEVDGAPGFLVVLGDAWYRSNDGGVHWEEVQVHDRPPGKCRGISSRAGNPASLLAWTRGEGEDVLFASLDGGRRWKRISSAPRIDRALFAPGDRLYAIFGETPDEKAEAFLATSTDGGATFSRCAPLPFVAQDLLVGRDGRTVQVFGTRFENGEAKTGRLARSIDAGATWTLTPEPKKATDAHRAAVAHPSGRWFHVPAGGQWLQFSDDEGANWNDAASVQPTWLAVDPTLDDAIYAGTYERLARITWKRAST